MTNTILLFREISPRDRAKVGGKGFVLASLKKSGLNIPAGICVTTDAYNNFVAFNGLKERILMELNRKPLDKMRWEEIWDAAFRIRNLFLRSKFPSKLEAELTQTLFKVFKDSPVAVRSSAPGEDSASSSFAGLHDSFLNVKGPEAIIEKIILVWASLWSDRALLYRRELGLEVEKSTIAVTVQKMIEGSVSGIGFGKNPLDDDQAVIEAVWGLNEGLVDGRIQPDRWTLNRETGRIIAHTPAPRDLMVSTGPEGTRMVKLPSKKSETPPLKNCELTEIFKLIKPLEAFLGAAVDFEWTRAKEKLYLLQARPITTGRKEKKNKKKPWEQKDQRPWYLGLQRNLDNLKNLRDRIEEKLIPQMEKTAEKMSQADLEKLSDFQLAEEIETRQQIEKKWHDIYWSEFIPFVHGIRLFGQVYNDAIRPQDPYEFMNLLGSRKTQSIIRNQMLEELAELIRHNPKLKEKLENSGTGTERFEKTLMKFIKKFGELSCGGSQCTVGREGIISIIIRMAAKRPTKRGKIPENKTNLKKHFLAAFSPDKQGWAKEVLEMGQASYQMRDDDNIYLAKIAGQTLRALEVGKARLFKNRGCRPEKLKKHEIVSRLKGENPKNYNLQKSLNQKVSFAGASLTARQLVGQPASPGLARGKARVITTNDDLFLVEQGDILVIDAIEPEMTFVIGLVGGIVERRGGMLIHGAIIAREYGLPCVTGIDQATRIIKNGDEITVDGFLGKVIIHSTRLS